MTLGSAVQLAAAHCPNKQTLDIAVCSYNWPIYVLYLAMFSDSDSVFLVASITRYLLLLICLPWRAGWSRMEGWVGLKGLKGMDRWQWGRVPRRAILFNYFWHAPLWVRSVRHRHHSPEWTILSHVNCFIQGEVQWFQVLLGSLHPHSTGLLQFSKICLASDSSGIGAVWPNRETPCLNSSWKM